MSLREILRLSRPLIVFDLETTSADVSNARIVQLGMSVHYPDKDVYEYHTLVNPQCRIPQEAIDAHGITTDILENGCARCRARPTEHPHPVCEEFKPVPRFADIAPSLHRGFVDADFGGFNIRRFDLPVLAAEFQRCGITFDYSTASIVNVDRIWQILEPRTLSDAVAHFGEEHEKILEGAHDAMHDVRGTVVALRGQLLRHRNSDKIPRDPRAIHDLCFPRKPNSIDSEGKFVFINGEPCLNFGKHKGKPMKDCKDYLSWMYGASFSPEVKRIVDAALAGKFPTQGV